MDYTNIKTFGELKKAGYTPKTIKEELRQNLVTMIQKGETVFEGVHGYEDTVIPELERAILSKHNINLLGLRGQAKTRLARLMVNLLDEYVPVVEGSEINDDPYNPISRYAVELLRDKADDTPISWLHRSERFAEKLATPDVTVADLIGDVDPIKAANLRLSYADDRVIHFGMIPRANRSIFVINELPDLQARIQVALFNILQEGDIQIRGFKLRLPLDVQFVFTANPEDYTNRGSIVTPLKDRIGSQILTHYPTSVAVAKTITAQEADLEAGQKEQIYVPELAREILEQISFEARNSEYIDTKSGVSARMSITAFQNLLSTAELRMLRNGDTSTTVRLSDFMGIVPAITGKVELVYEGEQEGAASVAIQLIENAIKTLFPTLFPKIEKLEKENERYPYDEIVRWFSDSDGIELPDDLTDADYQQALDQVEPIRALIRQYQPDTKPEDIYFLSELVLWGLTLYNKLSKYRLDNGLQFQDSFQGYLRNI
ncbi:sigma 54-interacting transcriptional regulator [Sphingobacterium chuzhouense]|uniref:Sigma 54-interacting transcriptional regulator n=1 Tax=Sphingobacterium chuzhouense TaxID=1742264 RepID=A0ABR7XSD7_9SPHI|nr:sigma 54-interacting transcriptional regulator [Sphingobacterium chuzhouense]MBD1422058.1 sigma 54-interacting transcriptional regulator [Sphingobacterium chuzhouense]